jgi:hypothetical protein
MMVDRLASVTQTRCCILAFIEVDFPDGSTEAIAANLSAENMVSQVEGEGRNYSVLSEIVDHRTNGHAILKDNGFVEDRYGKRHPRSLREVGTCKLSCVMVQRPGYHCQI